MAVMTPYYHVELNDDGVPMISGTTMKVVELVREHLAHHWSPESLQEQHPYLTMAQIHSALAFYWDHKAELDQDIQRRREYAERMRAKAAPSPFKKRLAQQ